MEIKKRKEIGQKRFISKYSKQVVIVTLLTVVMLTTFIVWDKESGQWVYKNGDQSIKFTLAPQIEIVNTTIMNDASKIDPTTVSKYYQPTSVGEIKKIVLDAKANGKKISISGIRHSMGGQAFLTNAVQIDITKFDAVKYNKDATITVESGATWKQVQDVLNAHGKAVAVMQDSNIFTVGGSVSVNAHGKDPHFGSIISTVNYLKLIDSSGNEVTLSTKDNPELFNAVIGGYGLFGVITEINLNTVDNPTYHFSLFEVNTNDLLAKFEKLANNPLTGLIEAHFSVDKDNLLTDSLIYSYSISGKPSENPVPRESNIWLRNSVFEFSKQSNFGKELRWELEKVMTPLLEGNAITRNIAMSTSVKFLKTDDNATTDILQEYFIPTKNFYKFLNVYRSMLKEKNINIMNLTLRKINRDNEALTPYATDDMYAFVAYYTINRNKKDINKLQSFTRELTDKLITLDGKYYLPYGSYYTKNQLEAMYPSVQKIPGLKQKYDPNNLFSSNWYMKYF